jgi:hypothetical protein
MKKRFLNWIFSLALTFIAKRIVWNTEPLTPEYLLELGWIEKAGMNNPAYGWYFEPNVKDRDTISIKFERGYYRVYHGPDKTFIDVQSSKHWLLTYLFLLDTKEHYKKAGI